MVLIQLATGGTELGDDRDGVDFDEGVRCRHLGDLDHGGCGRWIGEVLAAHFVYGVEVLHVAHVDVDTADIRHGSAGLLDRCLEVFADLPGLLCDIADPVSVPSACLASIPEMNTRRPCASTIVAWLKWPLGGPIRDETICFFGTVLRLPVKLIVCRSKFVTDCFDEALESVDMCRQ